MADIQSPFTASPPAPLDPSPCHSFGLSPSLNYVPIGGCPPGPVNAKPGWYWAAICIHGFLPSFFEILSLSYFPPPFLSWLFWSNFLSVSHPYINLYFVSRNKSFFDFQVCLYNPRDATCNLVHMFVYSRYSSAKSYFGDNIGPKTSQAQGIKHLAYQSKRGAISV